MLHLVGVVAVVLLGVSAAAAQDRGALAIDEAAGRHAVSLDGEADAVNMCGTSGCKVVATFSSCLGVGYSSPTQGQAVWTWTEAASEAGARRGALDECQRAGGPACEVVNVVCLTDSGGRDSGAAAPGVELPPEIQVDLNLRKAEQAVRTGDAATAREAMERVASLEREHGLAPSPEDHYRYAQAWASAGEPERAMAAAVRYLQLVGREAEHYTEALDLINREGSLEAAPASGNAASSRIGPGAPAGTPRVAVAQPQPGESRVFDGIQFVWVPAGEFLMGSTSAEARSNEQPLTRVRISQGFFLGKYEVTQAEWEAVMGSNPSHFTECGPDCPVEQVSWDDVQEFIRRLNATVGEERYRLPTEAEWEYAARAGTSGDRYGNLDAIAWCGGNGGWRTHPVGRKAPNAFGLHDMLGNVWEWVEDWAGAYPGGAVTDPRGPGSGSRRVIRGGGWGSIARGCRASFRGNGSPGSRGSTLGFRLLRTE